MNVSSDGSVVEMGIPKTIYDLNNCTLTPSPSGRALNLTHMLALSKVDFARAGSPLIALYLTTSICFKMAAQRGLLTSRKPSMAEK